MNSNNILFIKDLNELLRKYKFNFIYMIINKKIKIEIYLTNNNIRKENNE